MGFELEFLSEEGNFKGVCDNVESVIESGNFLLENGLVVVEEGHSLDWSWLLGGDVLEENEFVGDGKNLDNIEDLFLICAGNVELGRFVKDNESFSTLGGNEPESIEQSCILDLIREAQLELAGQLLG